jgi:hypothetical protein
MLATLGEGNVSLNDRDAMKKNFDRSKVELKKLDGKNQ